MHTGTETICTLILAGGQGSRMQNQDKGLMEYRGKPLIEHCLSHIHSDCILISANRNIERYQSYGYPVIKDTLDDFQGPLAGLLSAMLYTNSDYILTLPCDSPSPPDDLQSRLFNAMKAENKAAALCHDGKRLQPLFALISCQYKKPLKQFLDQGERRVQGFYRSIEPAIVDFSDSAECFNNFNRTEDLL